MTVTPQDFNDRETATVGMCLRLIRAMRSRYKPGIADSADEAETYLESNYGILQRMAAPTTLKKRRK